MLAVFTVSTAEGNYFILLIYFFLGLGAVFLFKPGPLLYLKRVFTVFLFPLSISLFIPFTNRGNVLYNFNLYFFDAALTDKGLLIFLTTLMKSFISIMVLAALVVSSTDLELLYGLRKIYFPKIIVSIIFLMYRYLFLIRDESRAGQIAISSRIFQKSYHGINKRLAFLAGSLFIKSFDRAENIYRSMESRGFTGEFYFIKEKENLKYKDIFFMLLFILALAATKCIELLKIVN